MKTCGKRLGQDIDIAVHCHWEYDWIDALRLARAVAPIEPMWLEDPMPPAYSESWIKLTQESPVPILTGENLYKLRRLRALHPQPGCSQSSDRYSQGRRAAGSKENRESGGPLLPSDLRAQCVQPVGAIASAHAAAAMRDFQALEFSPGNSDKYFSAVIYDGPIIKDGNWQDPG